MRKLELMISLAETHTWYTLNGVDNSSYFYVTEHA